MLETCPECETEVTLEEQYEGPRETGNFYGECVCGETIEITYFDLRDDYESDKGRD
jgi:hypothetical protein